MKWQEARIEVRNNRSLKYFGPWISNKDLQWSNHSRESYFRCRPGLVIDDDMGPTLARADIAEDRRYVDQDLINRKWVLFDE